MVLIKYGLQPAMLIAFLTIWYYNREAYWVYPALAAGGQILLGILEYFFPWKEEWVQPVREKAALIAVMVCMFFFSGLVAVPLYVEFVHPVLDQFRSSLGLNFWPKEWPLMAQVILAFFMSEFIWYWFHRGEHRWNWMWRISGHGAHHAFKRLNAINSTANHPLEFIFPLLLPPAIVEFLFGAGIAVAGSSLMLLALASMAHANLDLNSRFIGWLFTTNKYHFHHHSADFDESNTNYGCAAIIWDRVFGTFSDAETKETGIGPTQPSLWQLFIMPYKEPENTETAPNH